MIEFHFFGYDYELEDKLGMLEVYRSNKEEYDRIFYDKGVFEAVDYIVKKYEHETGKDATFTERKNTEKFVNKIVWM